MVPGQLTQPSSVRFTTIHVPLRPSIVVSNSVSVTLVELLLPFQEGQEQCNARRHRVSTMYLELRVRLGLMVAVYGSGGTQHNTQTAYRPPAARQEQADGQASRPHNGPRPASDNDVTPRARATTASHLRHPARRAATRLSHSSRPPAADVDFQGAPTLHDFYSYRIHPVT